MNKRQNKKNNKKCLKKFLLERGRRTSIVLPTLLHYVGDVHNSPISQDKIRDAVLLMLKYIDLEFTDEQLRDEMISRAKDNFDPPSALTYICRMNNVFNILQRMYKYK